jgi:methylmalonyl-CoA mutase
MQDDPWSMFASFDEAFWLEQADGLESKALDVKGLNLPLRGEKREDWPPLPSKAIEGDVFPNAWELQQRVDTNEALLQALEHGVEGIRIAEPFSLRPLLEGVHLDMVSLHLAAHYETSIVQDLQAKGASADLKGSWLDPNSWESDDVAGQVEHMKQVAAVFPRMRSWSCSSGQWINAGAHGPQAMAEMGWSLDRFMLAMESLDQRAQATHCVVLDWVVGEHILVEIACLRALRMFWSRWLEFHQLPDVAVWINARNAPYPKDPSVIEDHLIPQTAGVYAAVMGGADGVEALPHDAVNHHGVGSEEGLRWARNVHHIMREESGLHRVSDPMGGSAVVESWTHAILDQAWKAYRSGSSIELRDNTTR